MRNPFGFSIGSLPIVRDSISTVSVLCSAGMNVTIFSRSFMFFGKKKSFLVYDGMLYAALGLRSLSSLSMVM